MRGISSDPEFEMRALIGLASQIARLGYGEPIVAACNTDHADLRAARAAGLALSKIASFILFVIAGIGGGVLLGWTIGYNRGIEDGFDWIGRAIAHLVGG